MEGWAVRLVNFGGKGISSPGPGHHSNSVEDSETLCPRAIVFFSPEIGSGGQALWAASPSCFVFGRIVHTWDKGRGESQSSMPTGAAPPSRPLPSWGLLYPESQLVPRKSGSWGREGPGSY